MKDGVVVKAMLIVSLWLACCADASAQQIAFAPPGAASCTGCHGAAGAVPALRGRPAAEIVTALEGFRAGQRAATVMDRIARGFTPEESKAIAEWFSAHP